MVIFSGKEGNYSHGVAVILGRGSSEVLIGYSPISDRILQARKHATLKSMSTVQCYARTITVNDEEMDSFCDSLQETANTIPNHDIKVIMGLMNAKVGKSQHRIPPVGSLGLGTKMSEMRK